MKRRITIQNRKTQIGLNTNYDITACVPCYGRPQRTKRLIKQISEQKGCRWEAYVIGDCCADFQAIIDEGFFSTIKNGQNRLVYHNTKEHYGGYGYHIRNFVKCHAQGQYIVFIDNDDTIEPNHFSHYLNGIKDTDNDLVYFNSNIVPLNQKRITEFKYGLIGHSEIIVSTELYKSLPDQSPKYGHDWDMLQEMAKRNAKVSKAASEEATYNIMGVGELREVGIN